MPSYPRIGSRVKIKSTGETGQISAHAILRGSQEKIFVVRLEKPDSEGCTSAWIRYFDMEVIPGKVKKPGK